MEPTISSSINWFPYVALAVFLVLVLVALSRMGVVEAIFGALGLKISLKAWRKKEEGDITVEGIRTRSKVRVAGRDIGSHHGKESGEEAAQSQLGQRPIRVSAIERSEVDVAGRDIGASQPGAESNETPRKPQARQTSIKVSGIEHSEVDVAGRDLNE